MKASAPGLATDISTIEAFRAIAESLLTQISANRQGVIEGRDPEYLHQMRVALRRLRSLCSDYEKWLPGNTLRPLITEIKWLAHVLGPARDADVFATEIWPPLRAALGENSCLSTLDAQWRTAQRTAAATVRRALSTGRFRRLTSGTLSRFHGEAWRADASPRQLRVLDGAARDFARQAFQRRVAGVRGHGRGFKHLNAAQLHRLRIRVKKLRYTVDSFGSLFERSAVKGLLKHLSTLQDVLGEINDIQVAERQLATAMGRKRARAERELQAAFAEWRKAQFATLNRELRAAWRGFRHANVPM